MRLLVEALVLAVACGTVSLTITKSLFFRDLRNWVRARSQFWGELLMCPWCLSHWVVFAGMCVMPADVTLLVGQDTVSMLIVWFALTGIAGLFAGLAYRSLGGVS